MVFQTSPNPRGALLHICGDLLPRSQPSSSAHYAATTPSSRIVKPRYFIGLRVIYLEKIPLENRSRPQPIDGLGQTPEGFDSPPGRLHRDNHGIIPRRSLYRAGGDSKTTTGSAESSTYSWTKIGGTPRSIVTTLPLDQFPRGRPDQIAA
jgi:hypothetical protein